MIMIRERAAVRLRWTVLALVLGALFLGRAGAAEPAPWYVGGHVGIAKVDDEFGASDDAEVLRFNLGRQLSERITLELEAGGGSVSFDSGGDVDLAHAALNVMLVNRRPNWNPYFLVGVGAFSHDGDGFKDTGAAIQAAIGGMWDLNGYGMMLRADLRYRHTDLDEPVIDEGQAVLTVGIELPFGR